MKIDKEKWELVKLEDICHINIGKTPSRNNKLNFGNGYTWLSISDFTGEKYLFKSKEEITEIALKEANHKIIQTNTILLTFKLTIGKLAISGKPLFTNEAIASLPIKSFDKIGIEYLFTVLQTVDYHSKTDKAVKGATLNKEKLKSLPIPLPPVEEQQQIASLFQSIETAIEQLAAEAEKLKTLKITLVNGLFSEVPIFGNLLSHDNCKRMNFGELADCDKKQPEHEKEVSRFVGLENIEAENFQLNGWGEISDGTTFSKRFSKGDVLFGKRRAYLKKVAIADFDGICSGDILVLRAKREKLLQGLLPYYISADAFIQYAVSTSAGSLSPRTKWKDLAELEITLPDLETQPKILEVFNQLELTTSHLKQQKTTLQQLKQKLLNDILG